MNPKGLIAEKQSHLMLISTLLMLIVVIPVFMKDRSFYGTLIGSVAGAIPPLDVRAAS